MASISGVTNLWVLPAADEAVRCSDFMRALSVDPGGTGIRADLLLAVELPLPWPKPVFAHPKLVDIPQLVAAAPQPSRVLAAVPRSRTEILSVVEYRRDPTTGTVARAEWVTNVDGLAATVAARLLGETPPGSTEVDGVAHAVEAWVCTQGSHDLCCGANGTRLVQQVERRWPEAVVRRVSHTGGHRFAPTAITLPSGRTWGYLDPSLLKSALFQSGDHRAVAKICRGWWGAESGAAQVAERGVFASQGWGWDAVPRTVEVLDISAGVTTVRVATRDGSHRAWMATVRVLREVPTIACRVPGGLPVKLGIEYELSDLRAD